MFQMNVGLLTSFILHGQNKLLFEVADRFDLHDYWFLLHFLHMWVLAMLVIFFNTSKMYILDLIIAHF